MFKPLSKDKSGKKLHKKALPAWDLLHLILSLQLLLLGPTPGQHQPGDEKDDKDDDDDDDDGGDSGEKCGCKIATSIRKYFSKSTNLQVQDTAGI